MTVQQLIDELNKVEDKEMQVVVHSRYDEDFSIAQESYVTKETIYSSHTNDLWYKNEIVCFAIIP